MQVVRADIGDVAVLRVEGWLDATTSKDFEHEVSELVGPDHRRVVFDFTTLEYLSSAGLRVVLGTAKELRALHGALVICGANKIVARVFEVSGFSRIIPIVDTEQEALRKVNE
jgi:anti-anti-sigma factor